MEENKNKSMVKIFLGIFFYFRCISILFDVLEPLFFFGDKYRMSCENRKKSVVAIDAKRSEGDKHRMSG